MNSNAYSGVDYRSLDTLAWDVTSTGPASDEIDGRYIQV